MKLFKLTQDIWVNPNNVTKIKFQGGYAEFHMVDGSVEVVVENDPEHLITEYNKHSMRWKQ